ncbi:unnamed protein product [Cuscuta campestris]|uniref:Uncharacterized protein n=1 Tax=Cuscuta campestris TaxID=132261 RepID=A0A484N3K9_9ASTE|nr:unnamed protein product [Cuscuta campestris]
MASYENYPSGYALKALHGNMLNNLNEVHVHIDTFSAINGISRFGENDYPWRYSKEEGISLEEFQNQNFTFLLSERSDIKGFKCLFTVNGFSRVRLQSQFPPISLEKEPKVFVHGSIRNAEIMDRSWPQCNAIS